MDYLKKHFFIVIFSSLLPIVAAGYFYVKNSFILDSSSSLLKFIDGNSQEFLNEPQSGVYEDIRQIILNKSNQKFSIFDKLQKQHKVLSLYLKFIKQINGVFEDEAFDSILEDSSNPWSGLLIASKIIYEKSYNESALKDLPIFLSAGIARKGSKK